MSIQELPRLVRAIERAGRARGTPCAVIEWGTLPNQRTVTGTLATITAQTRQACLGPPAIFIVGDVVGLREQMQWFRREAPLIGTRVLVTRPIERAQELAGQLRRLGADVRCVPAIELVPIRATPQLHRALHGLAAYDWVLFTSPAGVERWMQHCAHANGAARDMRRVKIGVIGPKTAAAVTAHGFAVTCMPSTYQQEGLLRSLQHMKWQGKRVLLPRALEARQVLPETLRRWGAIVDVLPLYAARPASGARRHIRRLLQQEAVDVVTFTSSQCVEQLLGALSGQERRQLFARARIVSIGAVTSAAIRRHGLRVATQAHEATVPALAEAVVHTMHHKSHT